MYPFIETIRIEDGQIYNLDYHTERFNETRAAFWKDSTPLDLREFISPPTLNGIHKCRIVYGKEVEEVTYAPYQMRQVSSLHLVVWALHLVHEPTGITGQEVRCLIFYSIFS